MNQLFRKEAVDHAFRRLEGSVLLATPLSMKLLSVVLIAVVVGAAVFLSIATYARKETVMGWVAPSGGLIRVLARQGGVVEALNVSEGAWIVENAPTATLRLSSAVEAGDSGQVLIRSLDAENAAAEASLRAAESRMAATRASLLTQRTLLAREAGEAAERLKLTQDRQVNAEAAAQRAEALFTRQMISNAAIDNARSTLSSMVQATSQARSTVLNATRQIEDIDRQLAQMPVEIDEIRAKAEQARASIAQKRVNVQFQSLYGASAPISGTVVAVPVERGQSLAPGQTVAVIAPKDTTLLAELYVPSRAAGFIKVGQEVKLMYQAFPYQKFGIGHGRVVSVSKTVFGPGELSIPGIEMKEPVFRIRAKLDSQSVAAYGERIPLQPGMLLSADIIIDRRTLIEWLLDPLYAAGLRT